MSNTPDALAKLRSFSLYSEQLGKAAEAGDADRIAQALEGFERTAAGLPAAIAEARRWLSEGEYHALAEAAGRLVGPLRAAGDDASDLLAAGVSLLPDWRQGVASIRSAIATIQRRAAVGEAAAEPDGSASVDPAEDEAQPRAPRATSDALSLDFRAAGLLAQEPSLSMAELARRLGCSRQRLYQLPTLQKVRAQLKAQRRDLPTGRRDSDGRLDAWRDR